MLKRALLTWTESRIIFLDCLAYKAAYFLNSVLYFLVREGERMTNVKVTCACGAIYKVIETKGPSGSRHHLHASYARKNCSHGREIISGSYALYGALTRIEIKRKRNVEL